MLVACFRDNIDFSRPALFNFIYSTWANKPQKKVGFCLFVLSVFVPCYSYSTGFPSSSISPASHAKKPAAASWTSSRSPSSSSSDSAPLNNMTRRWRHVRHRVSLCVSLPQSSSSQKKMCLLTVDFVPQTTVVELKGSTRTKMIGEDILFAYMDTGLYRPAVLQFYSRTRALTKKRWFCLLFWVFTPRSPRGWAGH